MALHLPEEIIALILSHLRLPVLDTISEVNYREDEIAAAFATLTTVSRTSKALLVEPILYQVFPGSRYASPQLFLVALVSKPHRALLVNELALDPPFFTEDTDSETYNEYGYHDLDYDGRDLLPAHLDGGLNYSASSSISMDTKDAEAPSSEVHPLYQQCRLELHTIADGCLDPCSLRDKLHIQIESGGGSDVQSLLALMCRNVQTFDVTAQGLDNSFFFVLAKIAGRLTTVPAQEDLYPTYSIRSPANHRAIEQVVIRQISSNRFYDTFIDLWPLLQLDTVSSLTFHSVSFEDESGPFLDLCPVQNCPNIKTVDLHDCSFDHNTVKFLLRFLPAFASLTIKITHTWDQSKLKIDGAWLGAALEDAKKHLKHFSLDTRYHDPAPTSDNGTIEALDSTLVRYIGDLKGFTALRSICVTTDALLAAPRDPDTCRRHPLDVENVNKRLVDILPSTLQSLNLLSPARDPTWALTRHDTYQSVRQLMETPDFPGLSTVCLHSPSEHFTIQEHHDTLPEGWEVAQHRDESGISSIYARISVIT